MKRVPLRDIVFFEKPSNEGVDIYGIASVSWVAFCTARAKFIDTMQTEQYKAGVTGYTDDAKLIIYKNPNSSQIDNTFRVKIKDIYWDVLGCSKYGDSNPLYMQVAIRKRS